MNNISVASFVGVVLSSDSGDDAAFINARDEKSAIFYIWFAEAFAFDIYFQVVIWIYFHL